jgi:hypothetical protein
MARLFPSHLTATGNSGPFGASQRSTKGGTGAESAGMALAASAIVNTNFFNGSSKVGVGRTDMRANKRLLLDTL